MRFLADQDVYALTVRTLRGWGHDVRTAREADLAQAHDVDLLQAAEIDRRILVTRDRDFGSLVFVARAGRGVIYLRMTPSTVQAVHDELHRLLENHPEDELCNAFAVVEPGRYRIRTLSG